MGFHDIIGRDEETPDAAHRVFKVQTGDAIHVGGLDLGDYRHGRRPRRS